MKKILAVCLVLIFILTFTSCGKCEKCDGTGEVKETCYYQYLALGGQALDGDTATHRDLCPDRKCPGYTLVECEECNGTGKKK